MLYRQTIAMSKLDWGPVRSDFGGRRSACVTSIRQRPLTVNEELDGESDPVLRKITRISQPRIIYLRERTPAE